MKDITIGKLLIVWSHMKNGQHSVRTLDEGDPRQEFAKFKPGDKVVILKESDYKELLEKAWMYEELSH